MSRRGRSPVAWSLVLPVAAAELLLLVATANRYGYHRDELYFRVAARHPAWGYDDQPALTPLLGRFSEWTVRRDPRGLRVVSAVAIALVVVLVALIARELGAGRTGQAVAALATAASGAAMAVGHLLSTTTFDVLFWVTLVFLVARILGGGDERQWLLVGLVAGIGLENKHLVLLLVARSRAAASSTAAGSSRAAPGCGRAPRSRSRSGCRTSSGRRSTAGRSSSSRARSARRIRSATGSQLLPLQLLLDRPAPRAALARRSLVAPAPRRGPAVPSARVRVPRPARDRAVTGAKPYYTMGLLLALLGAGGVVAERWLRGRRGRKLALGVAIAVSAVVAALITLPLVPVADVHATPIPDINEDAIETIGWPAFAATVARVWNRCRQSERSTAVVYASNYGEAGAIARYGPALGHPARLLRAQRLLALRPPTRRRAPDHRGRLPRSSVRFVAPSAVARSPPGSTTASTSTTRSKAPRLDVRDDRRPWSSLWPRLRSLNP